MDELSYMQKSQKKESLSGQKVEVSTRLQPNQ